jgi:hypothetical protein
MLHIHGIRKIAIGSLQNGWKTEASREKANAPRRKIHGHGKSSASKGSA